MLEGTSGIIELSDPDIVGLCEVLEGQEERLKELLSIKGYQCFFGYGHKTKGNGLRLGVMLASKFVLEKMDSGIFPVKNKMGGGGGFVHCKAQSLNLDILMVHLSNGKNPKKKGIYKIQLEFLKNYVDTLNGKVILAGDFNGNFKDLEKYFPSLKLASDKMKTCSLTPPFKYFFRQDIDHIFVKGFDLEKSGSMEGSSDHKLIWADLS